MMRHIHHGRVQLALHTLREAEGDGLLLLHQLRGSARDWMTAGLDWRDGASPWPGPVHALDLSGHGESAWVRGGVYYAELFAADADAALAETGARYLAGAGVGAYACLLLAAGRRDLIRRALLLPGAGLECAGSEPDFTRPLPDYAPPADATAHACDPRVAQIEIEIRPDDYVADFAREAAQLLLAEDGAPRPEWWRVARLGATRADTTSTDLGEALRALAA